MLGIDISERSVSGLLSRRNPKPPSQRRQTFIKNHMLSMAAVDFLVVSTIRFNLLYVFLVLSHDRRKVVHFNVPTNPTAQWTAQQIVEAFPWDGAAEIQRRSICVEIETRSLAMFFRSELGQWISKKY